MFFTDNNGAIAGNLREQKRYDEALEILNRMSPDENGPGATLGLRAAHTGSDHDKGVNAIHGLARKIKLIESLTDYAKGITVNVGYISGGRDRRERPGEAGGVIKT